MVHLTQLGLSDLEALLYTTILRNPSASAQQISELTGVPRTSLYGALRSLSERGLVVGGAGYGSRFTALAPEVALPSLIERQRDELNEREAIAKELAVVLADLVEDPNSPTDDYPVEILRDRRVIFSRFERLQLEAERETAVLVKAPLIATKRGNPAEKKALARGIDVRAIYEALVVDDPAIHPHLASWIAGGEQARVFSGELPCKLALFDRRVALMPLVTSNEQDPVTMVVLRNAALGAGLGVLFDCLWKQSEPLRVS